MSAPTLGDCCLAIVDCEHKTAPIDEYGHHFAVGTPAMRRNRIDYAEARRISEDTFRSWTRRLAPQLGDLLLAREAPVGPVVRIPITLNVAPGQRTVLLRPNPDVVDADYLYYLMISPEVQRRLLVKAEGSTVAHLNVADVRSLVLPGLPGIEEQRRIARVLRLLDDKIESAERISRLAEDLAQTYFQSWFVDYEPWGGAQPSDWAEGSLRDVLDLVKKSTRPGNKPERPYLPIDCLPMRSLGVNDFRPNEEAQSSLSLFDTDDILIGAMRVYFHRVSIAPFDGITRTTCFVLRPKVRAYLGFALLLCNQPSTIDFADASSKGSTMPYAVWDGGLAELKILVPPVAVVEQFQELVAPLIERVRDGLFEIRKLHDVRDEILPSLIAGVLEATELEESVA